MEFIKFFKSITKKYGHLKCEVKTINNKSIDFEKVTKDKWLIQAGKHGKFKICYNSYANELNAGSTWIDDNQIYVNPVNCCLYVEVRENEQVKLFLNNLGHSQTAISLQKPKIIILRNHLIN